MSEPGTLPSPLVAGITSRCPRCGKGHVFSGFLKVADSCDVCGLSYDFVDSGDGPAVFIIFAVSPVIVILAFIVEALFHPAPLVHLMIWIPLTIILCFALLRPFKATMIALQYRNSAHEGHL